MAVILVRTNEGKRGEAGKIVRDALSHCLLNTTKHIRKCTMSACFRLECRILVAFFSLFILLSVGSRHVFTYSYQPEIIEIFCARHTTAALFTVMDKAVVVIYER